MTSIPCFSIGEIREAAETNDTQNRIFSTIELLEQCAGSGLTDEAVDIIQKYHLLADVSEEEYQEYYDHITTLKIDLPLPLKSPQVLKTEIRANQCLCFFNPGKEFEEEFLDRFLKAFPEKMHSTDKCEHWKRLYPMGLTGDIWPVIAQRGMCCACLGNHNIHECTNRVPRCENCKVNHAPVLFCRDAGL